MVFTRKSDQRPEFGSVGQTPERGSGNTQSSGYSGKGDANARPPLPQSGTQTESVIGNDLSIEGQSITIRCKGSLRINGNIQADLHSRHLTVGQEAQIQGSIAAETVEVHGHVSGAILGNRVILHRSAQVEGDIHSRTLSIEDGASFDGRSRKVTDEQSIAPQLESTNSSNRGDQSTTILTPPRLHS